MKRTLIAHAALAALLAALLAGCGVDTPDSPHVVLTGNEHFQTYVAIGGGMTAGFMDGGLIVNGQLGSYPSLLARQMGKSVAVSSSATFTQPYINFPGIGTTATGDPLVTAGVLHWTGTGIALLGTTATASVPSLAVMATLPAPYHNLAVPGATVLDVHRALTSANSQATGNKYFDLILRNPTFGNVTMRDQATGKKPTLVTVWIGLDEILGGATAGSPAVGVNITPPALFGALYDSLLANLRHATIARAGLPPVIVAGNLPRLGDLPYFVPKALFDGAAHGTVPTVEENVVYVRFPALGYLQGGGTLPLAATWTLTQAEADAVEGAVDDFNTQIAAACAAHGATMVDLHALFAAIHAVGGVDGLTYAHFAFGNTASAFSLDGVHPNNRGHGLVANAFLDGINAAAGTSLSPVDVSTLGWDPSYGTDVPTR